MSDRGHVIEPGTIQQISDEFFVTYGLDIFVIGTMAMVVLLILIGHYGGDRHFHYLNVACLPIFVIMVAYGYQYDDVIFLTFGVVGLFQTSVKVYEYWVTEDAADNWGEEA